MHKEKLSLFQGDSITDAGRVKESGEKESEGYGYVNMVIGEISTFMHII